jgi:hypothetical protein
VSHAANNLSREFDEANEVGEQLVVSGCDVAELFKL